MNGAKTRAEEKTKSGSGLVQLSLSSFKSVH